MENDVASSPGLALPAPRLTPPLDPEFRPAVLAHRAFRRAAARRPLPVRLAIERADGGVSVLHTDVADGSLPEAAGNFAHIERLLKFLL